MRTLRRPIQERGLILLIGLAVLASGLLVFTNAPHPANASTPQSEPILLNDVAILVPMFVDVEPVNINEAGLEELKSLPGIGPALAERIITYRDAHGPFESIEALQNVSGIGAQTVQRLLDQATVGPPVP